ncbi:intrastrand cross-link recognition protein isoform X4 [Drosophila elegans]|uniref:intrastrand cross-link recognition protein isoform X4 n=1 Tax=Drosophila elegans TaxID=30023 RepID=UPI001BC84640|nr:intrastrand cross-link recognition protein isoform X4 [Drosophila elegans]
MLTASKSCCKYTISEINEALELALQAIDREATTKPMDKKAQQPPKQEEIEQQEELAAQPKEEEEEPTQQEEEEQEEEEEEKELHTGGGEMPNKTDEQKQGEREPIYENVSSTISMHEVDNEQIATMTITTQTQATRRSHRRSIPNKQTSNNNNNENNQSPSPNQTNISSSSNQTENSTPAATATTAATTATAAATAATTSATFVPPAATGDAEPYYQVPKAMEPYYDAPKHLRPVPVYENIEIFYSGLEISQGSAGVPPGLMEPPKEKPPPPPTESPPPIPLDEGHDDELDGLGSSLGHNTDTWSSDNTYETISNGTRRHLQAPLEPAQPSPPIKRMNSTKRIKKELRNKRSSFLGIETDGDLDDMDTYLELTVAPPPDMAQLLQEERRLEKQLYIKAGLCDSSDTGESRDSGVSENHSRQSSEHYTNSSEENDTQSEATPPPLPPPPSSGQLGEVIYQNESLLAAQTPLLQTVKGNSAESWTESATAAAAATQSLSEATATANAKMQSIEDKIREQGEVLRVERELLHFSQEELKRQRENLLLRENLARRELQHGAKMLMSNNRRSLQDLHHGLGIGNGMLSAFQPPQHHQPPMPPPHPQQIYANVPQQQQQQQQQQAALYAYHQMDTDYRKSMSDLNEFSNRLMLPPTPPTKPLRAMQLAANGHGLEPDYAVSTRQRQPSIPYGGSLVKIAGAPMPPRLSGPAYPVQASAAAAYHHQSAQNLSNMSRNTLLALSATPKPKYTDGWVQVQQRKSYESHQANDPAWLSAQQQKRKSMPDYGEALYNNNNNHWLLQEAEQRRIEQLNRRSMPASKSMGKPLPDSIIQTLTERVQSKGIGERKRFDGNGNYSQVNGNTNLYQQPQQQTQQQQQQQKTSITNGSNINGNTHINTNINGNSNSSQEKVLSVSGKKKCSNCGDELGRGAAMIIESLLLFYHINCFKCCVCHVQLGDGLNGTDVRVRNHKLHCQNCYSSDDGIKFSCV